LHFKSSHAGRGLSKEEKLAAGLKRSSPEFKSELHSTETVEATLETVTAVGKQTRVIVITTAMLTFISFWRVAAVVLCDLASTAYYIGGIVEEAVGKSAPYFILAVMLFSYAVRAVYVESCSMFTRGGVYRVVKEAMGGTLAKISVSALMFDYILTGPISGVSAGQYLVGLINDPGGFAARSYRGAIRDPGDGLLLAPKHPGNRGVQLQGHVDYAGHHGDGGDHYRLVRRDALCPRI
jgi:hypothetical protein